MFVCLIIRLFIFYCVMKNIQHDSSVQNIVFPGLYLSLGSFVDCSAFLLYEIPIMEAVDKREKCHRQATVHD